MAKMVDVSMKSEVLRLARARGCIKLRRETIERIKRGEVEKGDVISVTSVVAIQGAKLAHQLLPFCHPVRIDVVSPHIEVLDDRVCVEVEVKSRERTGLEMEALASVVLALLNVWDMVKKYEKDERGQYPYTEILEVRVIEKVKEV